MNANGRPKTARPEARHGTHPTAALWSQRLFNVNFSGVSAAEEA